MTLIIPDSILRTSQLDPHALLVDFACYLFDKQRFSLPEAAAFADMNRTEFEDELRDRHIPIYRLTLEDFQLDLHAVDNIAETPGTANIVNGPVEEATAGAVV